MHIGNLITICGLAVLPLALTSRVAVASPQAGRAPDRIASEQWPQTAPKLVGGPADWINTDGKALNLQQLIHTGHVVLVDFWEYTCVNCQRTLPYLKEWNRRYAKDGLVIIGIHTPEFAFARDPRNVAQAVKDLGIAWPVIVDSDHHNWDAFANSYWPRKYFIDKNGRIVADHAGEGGYEESEAEIQTLLRQLHPGITFPHPMNAVRDTDKPGAVCYPTTPELYAGERGAYQGQHGNIAPFVVGKSWAFTDPGAPHEDGKIIAQGAWTTLAESLRHARTTETPVDYIALRYHALEANAVIKPEGGKPLDVFVMQDGKPIARQDAGADIKYDPTGKSYLLVDQPRMYRLTKNAKFGSHELRMATNSQGFGLYSFTFSSCEVK